MVSEDKMQEEIDREIKVCRAKLEHVWQMDKKVLHDLENECKKIGG